MQPLIEDDSVVLFQGDSITDAGRSREDDTNFGVGYANMAAAFFTARHPERNVRFLNRGIGGNRVPDLQARWQTDCLDLKPDWVSIMIGINDTWRAFDGGDPTGTESYEEGYRDILTQTRDVLGAKLVIIEPFLLPTPPDRLEWRKDLDPKIQAARQLAREFNAIYVPMDGLFAAASMHRDPAFWTGDGVHPSQPGHAFIADAWLKAVRAI